jgi:hypothetical protein
MILQMDMDIDSEGNSQICRMGSADSIYAVRTGRNYLAHKLKNGAG